MFLLTLLHTFAHSLKIGLIEAGLLLPQGDVNLRDLVVARSYSTELNYHFSLILRISGDILEIGAFCSIRSRDVPSFDRYFSQLQTFYTDYRSVIYMKFRFYISIRLKRISPALETGIRHSRP